MNDKKSLENGGVSGANEFENLHEIVRKARQNLSQNAWATLVGGTETETTLRRNRLALDSIAFRPRVLRDVSRMDTSVEQFGRRLRLPVLLAPTGPLELFGRGAGATVVRAAQAFGVAHMLSSDGRGHPHRDRSRRRLDLRFEPRRSATRPRPRIDGGASGNRRCGGRPRQGHDRRIVLPRHRHQSRRSPPAPTWSRSGACNATRWRPAAKPRSSGCSN